MRNPLRSEAEMYRFLLLTIAYFAVIAAASLIFGKWVGLAVFIVATVAIAAWFLHAPGDGPPPPTVPSRPDDDMRRILVIANETVGGAALLDLLSERAHEERTEVLVVSPALNSPLRQWVSDEDGARSEAQQRLEQSLARLRAAGVNARGEVGDPEPLQAIEDALRKFGADEIVISSHPPGRSNWLEQRLIERAHERFAVPIHHVVGAAERADA
jgi:4-amino-4-deoxy-L-arabinose transferase-like glycosyltransferase